MAEAWEGPTLICDELIDPERGHAASRAALARAFDWFLEGDDDPTAVEGISSGDLAGAEVAHTVFVPAVRERLAGAAAREHIGPVEELLQALPRPGAPGHYDRVEAVGSEAFALGCGGDAHQLVRVEDGRNFALRAKYAKTRDPEWLAPASRRSGLLQVLAAAASVPSRRRRRDSMLVLEYNPTAAFGHAYARASHRALQIVRVQMGISDLLGTFRGGHRVFIPHTPSLVEGATMPAPDSVVIDDLDVTGAVAHRLPGILSRYASFVERAAPGLRALMGRQRVRVVLVPFDSPPWARLLVRVAQQLEIPTVVVNDGYKADDLQSEGFAADTALAWSESIARHYFSRRPGRTVVVGRPAPLRRVRRRQPGRHMGLSNILVGGFTFSPIDVNCRRSDVERFTRDVISGARVAAPSAVITLKLHPADLADHYTELARESKKLSIVTSGDVMDYLDNADVYITTYSTSLLDAIAAGVPSVYYRVNAQRIGPPFDGDPWLQRRTAQSVADLADLLAQPRVLSEAPPPGWTQDVLGNPEGALERIAEIVERTAAPCRPEPPITLTPDAADA